MSQNPLNLSQYCRICVTEAQNLRNLFRENGHGESIVQTINVCTRIQMKEDEGKPNQICDVCVKKLNTVYEFHNLVKYSEKKCEQLIANQWVLKMKAKAGGAESAPNCVIKQDELIVKLVKPKKEIPPINGGIGQTFVEPEDIFIAEPEVAILTDDNDPPMRDKKQNNEKQSRAERAERRSQRDPVFGFEPHKKTESVDWSKFFDNKSANSLDCNKCNLTFRTAHKTQMHLKEHDPSETCRICMRSFTRNQYLEHLCEGSEITCEYCQAVHKTTVDFIRHINKDHKDHRNYKCYKCARSFHTKALLEIHKPSHDKEEKRFICDICDERFRTRYLIKEHMEITHTDKRSFLCATCGKNFTNPTSLRIHSKRHTSGKTVLCPKCPMKFWDKHGLKKHFEVHDDDKQFVCDICGSVMRSKGSYSEHMRRHKTAKVYTCEVCNKQIKTSLYNLKLHMYTHTGEKPFKCPYCDRRYTQNADLNKHLRTHVGENTYKCDKCSVSFRLLGDMRRHICEKYQQNLANGTTNSMEVE